MYDEHFLNTVKDLIENVKQKKEISYPSLSDRKQDIKDLDINSLEEKKQELEDIRKHRMKGVYMR